MRRWWWFMAGDSEINARVLNYIQYNIVADKSDRVQMDDNLTHHQNEMIPNVGGCTFIFFCNLRRAGMSYRRACLHWRTAEANVAGVLSIWGRMNMPCNKRALAIRNRVEVRQQQIRRTAHTSGRNSELCGWLVTHLSPVGNVWKRFHKSPKHIHCVFGLNVATETSSEPQVIPNILESNNNVYWAIYSAVIPPHMYEYIRANNSRMRDHSNVTHTLSCRRRSTSSVCFFSGRATSRRDTLRCCSRLSDSRSVSCLHAPVVEWRYVGW